MREYGLVIWHERCAVFANGAVDLDVFQPDPLRFFNEALLALCLRLALGSAMQSFHALDRPKKIYCSRPRSRQSFADCLEVSALSDHECNSHSRGNADRRSTSN